MIAALPFLVPLLIWCAYRWSCAVVERESMARTLEVERLRTNAYGEVHFSSGVVRAIITRDGCATVYDVEAPTDSPYQSFRYSGIKLEDGLAIGDEVGIFLGVNKK